MKKKRLHNVTLLALLIGLLIWTSCEPRQIKVTSVTIAPYRAEERGKFINMCFNETIRKNDKLYVNLHFESNTGKTFKYGTVFYGDGKSCERFNVFVKLSHRHSTDVETDFLRNHLNKGNIKKLDIEVLNKYGGQSLFKGTFNDL